MQPLTIFAIFFIIWWLTFFAVLPWGVRSQLEEQDITLGTEYGAPVKPAILKKMIITTGIAAVITAGVMWFLSSGFSFDDLPFFEPIKLY